jgi:transcriptional regulator GlxA family with amidase domain
MAQADRAQAGIDLALGWVEEDCGSPPAHEVARELVFFLRRPAGQGQLSVSLAAQAADTRSIQELQVWIAENMRRKLSMRVLVEQVSMSVRNFQRVFTREVGQLPLRYVRQTRVEAAGRQLELTDQGPKGIARSAGFSSVDLTRRAFPRVQGITPGQYCKTIRVKAYEQNCHMQVKTAMRPKGMGFLAGQATQFPTPAAGLLGVPEEVIGRDL